ncbi:hypothetical protein LTS17_010170 [Exophiala oligosperma]
MDHLPTVSAPAFPPLQIPYLRAEDVQVLEYDNQGFTGFPSRAGWDKTNLINATLEGQPARTVASFVQQWLFFGLLSASTGHMFPMADLVRDFTRISPESGTRVIYTGRLEQYLVQWRNSLDPEQLSETGAYVAALDAILDEAQRHVARYMCRGGDGSVNHQMREYPDISLSIMALGVTLTRAKLRIWPDTRIFSWQHSELILSRMTEARWCPSDISMLEKLMTPSGMYFASLLRPRMAQHNHVGAECNQDKCNVMNISEEEKAEYQTAHTRECPGSCEWQHVSEAQLKEILEREGGLPVVKVEATADGQVQLNLSAKTIRKDGGYVAISHVWAERLGNTRDNSMPTCQLRRIQSMVTAVSGSKETSFWIDTLCVPQDNFNRRHLRPLRLRAIRDMDKVYGGSACVLVLDSELLSTNSTSPFEEQLVRFACCSWIRRLWTLSEAVNGPKVMLQFADGPVDMMTDIFHRLRDHNGFYALSQTVLTELTDFMWRIVLVRNPEETPRITAMWNACQFRNTSEGKDEAFCLATILGFDDTRPILDAPREDRWRIFLLQQRIFPKDLLFSSGPRVEQTGYRWAPRKFIGRPATTTATLPLQDDTGEATPHGFMVNSRGYAFDPPRARFWDGYPAFWLLDNATQKWYLVAHRMVQDDGQMPWPELTKELQRCKRIGVVVNKDLDTRRFALGILVDISSDVAETFQESVTYTARFLATVNVMLEQHDRWETLRGWRNDETEGLGTHTCRTVSATPVEPGQAWCIG